MDLSSGNYECWYKILSPTIQWDGLQIGNWNLLLVLDEKSQQKSHQKSQDSASGNNEYMYKISGKSLFDEI